MFNVGDRVWEFASGWGKVVGIKDDQYCVRVQFDHGQVKLYTTEGKLYQSDINCTLFHTEVKYEVPKEIVFPVKDQLVEIFSEVGWIKRYATGHNIRDGRPTIEYYQHGATSETQSGIALSNSWRLVKSNQ